MRTRSRNDEEKFLRREVILDAAMQVFFSKGFEKASMDEIAKKAKLSRSLIYVYFKDKIAVHMGLCLRAGQALLRYQEEGMAQCKTGIEKVYATGEAYYAFYREEPNLFKIMSMKLGMLEEMQPAPGNETPYQLEMQKFEDQIMHQMVLAIESGLADGTIDKAKVNSPLQTAMFMRGSLHGVIQLQDSTGSRLFDRVDLDREGLIKYSHNLITATLAVEEK